MSREDERRVSELLNRRLTVTLTGRKYRTEWGEADDHVFLTANRLLILEVERNQRHPGTNVLKIWPQLHRRRRLNIMLVHAFIEGSKAMNGSRKLLNDWISDRLEKEYWRRFKYHQLIVSDDFRNVTGITALKKAIRLFRSNPL